ncbi:hypothetical protein ACWCZ5_35120 [Streptomyces sp. NPDC001667]
MMAADVTVVQRMWSVFLAEVSALVGPTFARSEPRRTFREFVQGMVMGVPLRNCWTIAEALGHAGPSRLQHFLACAGWDHDEARDLFAAWALGQGFVKAVVRVGDAGGGHGLVDHVDV